MPLTKCFKNSYSTGLKIMDLYLCSCYCFSQQYLAIHKVLHRLGEFAELVYILTLPAVDCVIPGKILNFAKSHFSQL